MTLMTHRCDYCHAPFTATRSDARFCSTAHRSARTRLRRNFAVLRLEETRAQLAHQLAAASGDAETLRKAETDLRDVRRRTDELLAATARHQDRHAPIVPTTERNTK